MATRAKARIPSGRAALSGQRSASNTFPDQILHASSSAFGSPARGPCVGAAARKLWCAGAGRQGPGPTRLPKTSQTPCWIGCVSMGLMPRARRSAATVFARARPDGATFPDFSTRDHLTRDIWKKGWLPGHADRPCAARPLEGVRTLLPALTARPKPCVREQNRRSTGAAPVLSMFTPVGSARSAD